MIAERSSIADTVSYEVPRFLTLVSQGGGIGGGAYILGVVTALKEAGILRQVTDAYLSSAAIPATLYPIMGKDRLAEQVWTHEVTRKEVVDVRRVAKGGPILDIDFLIDKVLRQHPFDDELYHTHPTRIHISTTHLKVDRFRGELNKDSVAQVYNALHHRLYTNRERYDPMDVMHMGIAVPLIYGKTKTIDGNEGIDGGLIRQIPFPSQRKSPLIVIITDPKVITDKQEARQPFIGERILMKRYPPQTLQDQIIYYAVAHRHVVAQREYQTLRRRQNAGELIVIIQPEQRLFASQTENEPEKVKRTIDLGKRDAEQRMKAIEQLLTWKDAA